MIHNLLDRMKLPFRKNKEFLSVLYDILGFYPHDVEIYRVAFSHKSLTYHTEPNGGKDRRNGRREKRPRTENTSKPLNNERLEYLGDAVLETVVSDILFRHFEHKREGFLTSTRSKIVQREALNRLAEQMGLEALIQAAQGTRMSHTNIGGNAFEALMGAIYLDRGFKYCHWFITNRVIGTYVDLDTVAQKEVNFKSKLLEWCQKNRINTDFRDSGGADGERGFRTSIVLEGITVGKGSGRSKKESQQVAAKDALSRMRREQKLYDSIFRAKEKRTAMEADESFALPKIDEAEDIVSKAKGKDKPVLEDETGRRKNFADADGYHDTSDAAYDEAYGDNPKYEVIDDPDNESEYSDYATSIQPDEDDDVQAAPAPTARTQKKNKPAATKDAAKDKAASGKEKSAAGKEKDKPAQSKDAAEEAERKPQTKAERKRERNRTAKTIDDAVKGSKKVKAEAPAPKPEQADAENAADEADANTPELKPMSESAKRRQRRKARREAMEADETNPFVELDKERKEEADASSAAEVSSTSEISSAAEVEENVLETVELHVAPEADEAKADIEPELSAAEPEAVTTAEEEETEASVSSEPQTPAEPTSEEPVVEEPVVEEEPAEEEAVSTSEAEPQSTEAEAPQAETSAEPIEADADDIETDSDDEEVPSESSESSDDDNVSDNEETDKVNDDEEDATADEEEEEYDEDDEEETPSEPHALAEEAALPKLRHITLDDFVFGATDATTFDRDEEASSDNDAEGDNASDERRQRNARSRRRKPNRGKKPADKAEKKAEAPKGEGKAKKHNADDEADAQVRIDREKAAKRRAQQRRRRRRESNKGDNFAGEE